MIGMFLGLPKINMTNVCRLYGSNDDDCIAII